MSHLANTAFAACAGFVLYVLFGYPALLAVLARYRTRPVLRKPHRRTVSVLLPVRNGERWVRAKLESILAVEYPRELMEIVVVSDGSDDDTDAIVREFQSAGVQLIRIERAGKAAALNAGMAHCRGEIMFFTDVRQELAPDSLDILVSYFADPHVGVVSGELVMRNAETREAANVGLYWEYEKWIRRQLSRVDSVLGATGCIYAMRRELAVPLPAGTLADDMHLPLAAFFAGYRIVMTQAMAYDDPATLKTEFSRKVRTLAGVYQVIAQYPALLGPGNRMWIHFVSHKLGRLLLPWALLALAGITAFLPGPRAVAAAACQIAVYGLAAMDPVIPDSFVLKRISSLCRTFTVLMAASLCAASICFRSTGAFWSRPTGAQPSPPKVIDRRVL